VGAGVGAVQGLVEVGQGGVVAVLVDVVGQVAVGVVGVGAVCAVGFGDLAELVVGGPGLLGGVPERVGDRGDPAAGVVAVGRGVAERVGHGRGAGRRVVAVAGRAPSPIGERLDPTGQGGPIGVQVVGVGALMPVRVAHGVDLRILVRCLGVGVNPVCGGQDGRAGSVGGHVGEHPGPVGHEGAARGGAAALGDPQQVAVVVVVEMQDVPEVVGDVGDPAALVGIGGLRLGVVADRHRAAARVADLGEGVDATGSAAATFWRSASTAGASSVRPRTQESAPSMRCIGSPQRGQNTA
jgi:hypothetical protein